MTSVPRLLVGSYTPSSGGTAEGISLVEPFDPSAGTGGTPVVRTLAVLDDPSFLAVSGDRVYAVAETEDGRVHAYRRTGSGASTGLEHLWDVASGGDAPCHVRVDPSGALVVTNYVSGTVTAVGLEAAETLAVSRSADDAVVLDTLVTTDGAALPESVTAVEILPDVEGPVEDRQEGPHAHQSIATPDGTVLVADLGGDALHEFRITSGGAGAPGIEQIAVHHVAPGVGPRHIVWYDGDLLVSGELDGAVHRLRRDGTGPEAPFTEVASAPAFDGAVGESLLSHIDVDDAGRVYVAVRGRDTIAVFDAADGGLSRIAEVSCGGTWPRHFALVDGAILVANQLSDAIAVLPLGSDGVPGDPVAQIPVGSPTCIVPLP